MKIQTIQFIKLTMVLILCSFNLLLIVTNLAYAQKVVTKDDLELADSVDQSQTSRMSVHALAAKKFAIAKVLYNANLRYGPGTDFAKVGNVPKGKIIYLVSVNSTGDWYRLKSGEWIAAFLVKVLYGELTSNEFGSMATPVDDAPNSQTDSFSSDTRNPFVSAPCSRPPDDMHRAYINNEQISARTLWMLQLAQQIYGGPGSILRVVQGSYEPGLQESFGTHDGGGAVDISIRNPANPEEILFSEASKMVLAMRQAGFAAWYRPTGMFGPNSGAHIHAIAIGDPELSESARRQLDGPEGYFRGLDGIPPAFGGPSPDLQGGPILCQWMLDMGFDDLR